MKYSKVRYDPSSPSGLVWVVRTNSHGGAKLPGDPAGTLSEGRWIINGMKAHRLIWTQEVGPIPEGMEVDHIDLNPLNNRLDNLRLATRTEQQHNTTVRSDSGSGIKGVTWHKAGNMWRARITSHGKQYVKRSTDINVCIEWLADMRQKLHGEFARYE